MSANTIRAVHDHAIADADELEKDGAADIHRGAEKLRKAALIRALALVAALDQEGDDVPA